MKFTGFISKLVFSVLFTFSLFVSAAVRDVVPGEVTDDRELQQAMRTQRQQQYVEAGNLTVSKLLPDDTVGLPHQKWEAKLSNGAKILVVYNLDMGNDVKLRLPIKPKLIDGLDIDVSMIQERSFGRTARPERNEMTYKLGEYATRSSSPYDVDGETDDEEDGETDDEEDIERDTFREKDMSDVILDDVESFKNADDNDQLLLAEITELKERIDLIEEDHDAAIKDLYSKCEDIEGKIDEQNSTLENALGEPLNA